MKKTLDANQLQLIAIFAMTVDHIAWLLFPGYAKGAVSYTHLDVYKRQLYYSNGFPEKSKRPQFLNFS